MDYWWALVQKFARNSAAKYGELLNRHTRAEWDQSRVSGVFIRVTTSSR
jgi:hypothetical protein